MADAPQVKNRMTVEEFMSLPESTVPTELIAGELIVSPAPKDPHQKSSTHLLLWLGQTIPNGEIRHQPTDLHLDGNVLQPDMFWVSADNPRCILRDDGYWHGPPDLVIEILSPSTELRDRGDKFDLYEQAGVREYWLVEPVARFIEIYVREDDQFRRYGVFGPDKQFESPVLNGQQVNVGTVLA